MPELPDVDGFRRYLDRHATGRTIRSVRAIDSDLIRNTNPQGLGRALSGKSFGKPSRHGKWLIAPVGEVELLIHFGMTGRLAWSSDGADDDDDHDRVCFDLGQGSLRYRDTRKFGGIWLLGAGVDREQVTGPLGPDALELDEGQLAERLEGRRGGIKSALMDQALVAGLGNLLSDEILWRARINPRRRAAEIPPQRIAELRAEMHAVLRESNRHRRVPAKEGWLTGARDADDPSCPRCGTRLERAQVAGRTTVWCPREQPG